MANVTPLPAGTVGAIVIAASPFLNAGTISGAGGTISAAAQSLAGVAGWFNNGTSIIAAELAIDANMTISASGTLGIRKIAAGSLFGNLGTVAAAGSDIAIGAGFTETAGTLGTFFQVPTVVTALVGLTITAGTLHL